MNSPIKFHVEQGKYGRHYIIATYSHGGRVVWGEQKTERGIRSCMTRYAKRFGMTVTPAESCFDLTAA